jgi:predicted nucleic acid-binding protein
MSVRTFLDTNICIYALNEEPPKSRIAFAALANQAVISVQVLNEYTNVARRKLRLPWTEIADDLAILRAAVATIRPLELSTHTLGRDVAERHQLQLYDSLLLASALEAGCKHFFSEDMQNGMVIDGLRIVNPFTP